MIALEINNQTKGLIFSTKLKKVASVLSRELKIKKKYNVSVAFVNKAQITELNKRFRKKNKVTDVLSFIGEDDFLGEIIICINQAKKQAKEFGHSYHREIQFLLIHGLLHLLGYTHRIKKNKKKMEALQNKIIKKL